MLATLSASFTACDWLVVAAYLALTTWLGMALAGRQATIRDFFLGGRKLPWYAVSGSIIATEISAVTFVGLPAVVFAADGDFTYLQLGLIGTFLARIIVGYLLVPAYYQREIYSPYDYIGDRLGGNTRAVATALFALGGLLAQSARVYLTALVLTVVLGAHLAWLTDHFGATPLAWAIILISIVAILWTFVGGITTVIWTDVLLFLVFLAGAIVALVAITLKLDGGLAELFHAGWQTRYDGLPPGASPAWYDWGKFTVLDPETRWPERFTKPFTLLAAVVAITWGSLFSYGTDQLIVQRMFCCRSAKHARWAIISSTAGVGVALLIMFVGVGLYAFYRQHPLTGEAEALFAADNDRIFPIFIVQELPVGVKGLLIASIFAAAISSLTSILAALSQTVMSAFYLPLRQRRRAARPGPPPDADPNDDRHAVRVGRIFVLAWGIALGLLAYNIEQMRATFPELLNLALALAGYAGGALLAGFFLGFLRLRIDGWGYQFAAPLSVLFVFAIVFHAPWSHAVCWIGGSAVIVFWFMRNALPRPASRPVLPRPLQGLLLLAAVAGMLAVNHFGYFDTRPSADGPGISYVILAWPWYVPLGSLVAFALGYTLARRRAEPLDGS